MHPFIQQATERAIRADAERLTMEILVGCFACGKRIVHDGKAIEGAIIASHVDHPFVTHPLCGSCASQPCVVREVFNESW